MKRSICVFLFMLIAINTNADVYLTFDKNSLEVIDMSKRRDVVLKEEWSRVELPGKLTDYPIQYHPKYYKWINDRLVVNVDKLSNEEIIKQTAEAKKEELHLIDKKAKLLAMKELKKEGKEFKHVKESDFE